MLILLGAILPPVIGIINKHISNSDTRFLISVIICSIVGLFINFVEHNGFPGYLGMTMLEIANSYAESIMVVIGMTKVSYEVVWDNKGLGSNFTKYGSSESILQQMDLKNVNSD